MKKAKIIIEIDFDEKYIDTEIETYEEYLEWVFNECCGEDKIIKRWKSEAQIIE